MAFLYKYCAANLRKINIDLKIRNECAGDLKLKEHLSGFSGTAN
jgi:hypothetical protein